MNWIPKPHKVINNITFRNEVYELGYVIAGNLGEEKIKELKLLYQALHNFKEQEGGMFYSLYSNDIDYRKKVHYEIDQKIKTIYDDLFTNYKTVINSFIVKISGPKSDFTLHQDSTGLNEFDFSPLSLWIPLQDTTLDNGTLCVVPKTHGFFHPYRGISFPSPFSDYEEVLRKYLVPINLKAGDILMFDNRLVHYSHLNNSGEDRIVVMSGIFPKEADIWSVYKDETQTNSPIEIYKQSEDFLITNTAFYENCTDRPYRGEIIKSIIEPLEQKTVYDFLSWTKKHNIKTTNIDSILSHHHNMKIVAEPI